MPMPAALLSDEHTAPTAENLGQIHAATNIASSLAPFHALSGKIVYPVVVTQALMQLFGEYNDAFKALVQASMEWPTDYRHCNPANAVVQIDMVGLPQSLLDQLADQPLADVVEFLRLRLFEIENSVAMYQLLERICYPEGETSFLAPRWRSVLEGLRVRSGLPVALLAVTEEKYWSMVTTEFGLPHGVRPSAELVRELTGFDAFYGPDEFLALVAERGEDIGTLLYVRASDPAEKLKKPSTVVAHPLLADPRLRRIIRAFTVTVNIDDPAGDPNLWINDTKSYAPEIGLGVVVTSQDDLFSAELHAFLAVERLDLAKVLTGQVKVPAGMHVLSGELLVYLAKHGITEDAVLSGQVWFRGKPLIASFGSYGHVRGPITSKSFRADLRVGLRQRAGGCYLIQPELAVPVVLNTATGVEAGYIDRCWVGLNSDDEVIFLGGFRNYMPTDSGEYQHGRIHGNGLAFWSPIVVRS